MPSSFERPFVMPTAVKTEEVLDSEDVDGTLEALFEVGRELLADTKYAAAIRHFNETNKKAIWDGASQEILGFVGIGYEQRYLKKTHSNGDLDNAASAFKEALRLGINDPKKYALIVRKLAMSYRLKMDYSSAIRELKKGRANLIGHKELCDKLRALENIFIAREKKNR